jgi:N-hydroxyarylamine O-acetyltransferase
MNQSALNREQLEIYLDRVKVKAGQANLELLSRLTKRHLETFSFSNISVLLGSEMSLTANDVFDRIVTSNKGGYCYEQNGLFYHVLNQLGFEVECGLARVLFPHKTPEVDSPLTHRFNWVTLESQTYCVDVGFSQMTPREPTPLSEKSSQKLIKLNDREWLMRQQTQRGWQPLYRMEYCAYPPSDVEMGHFWSHQHPAAPFKNTLVASRISDTHRVSLRNTEFWEITDDSSPKITNLQSSEALHECLQIKFGLTYTKDESDQLYAMALNWQTK